MNNNDVRAAAERLHDWEVFDYAMSDDYNREHDIDMVVCAWLAEHFEDDDVEWDSDWVLAIGGVMQPRTLRSTGDEIILGGRLSFFIWDKGGKCAELCGGGEVVASTRGDVRRLLRSLGVNR